jgi:hypothetical protein
MGHFSRQYPIQGYDYPTYTALACISMHSLIHEYPAAFRFNGLTEPLVSHLEAYLHKLSGDEARNK